MLKNAGHAAEIKQWFIILQWIILKFDNDVYNTLIEEKAVW